MTAQSRRPETAESADGHLPAGTDRSLPIALLRAREAVMSRFRPMLAAHDITEQQWRTLRVLAESGPLDLTQLAGRACLLAPSLTRIVRTLETRGLVMRARHGSDNRRTLLTVTPSGLAFIGAVAPQSAAIYAEIEARLGHRQLESLLDRIETLIDSLS